MNIPRPIGLGPHGRQESNLQPSVLETDALPVELRPYEVLRKFLPEMPEAARTKTGPRRLHERGKSLTHVPPRMASSAFPPSRPDHRVWLGCMTNDGLMGWPDAGKAG